MPMPGYVNIATSLKAEEAKILKAKLNEAGFASVHAFLRYVAQNRFLTSNFTSKSPENKGLSLNALKDADASHRGLWWAGADSNHRPPLCESGVLNQARRPALVPAS